MKMNINIVANILRADAERYKKEYDRLLSEKENALENAKKDFIGEKLKAENERIENEFNAKIIDLKAECTRGVEDINSLKKSELEEVQKINPKALEKVNAIANIPLSEDEFLAFMEDSEINSNYFAKKTLMHVAESNGIDVAKMGFSADYSTKLDILNGLEEQLTKIVENYPDANYDRIEALKCKHAYLSEDVVNRAIQIYGGVVDLKTDEEKASRAWLTIKSKASELERSFAIRNALRNAKEESVRNRLLYNLSNDSELTEITLQMSGAYSEIDNFRKNSAKEYKKAVEAMERVQKSSEKEVVDLVLEENRENQFFNKMYDTEVNKNEFLRSFMNPQYMES